MDGLNSSIKIEKHLSAINLLDEILIYSFKNKCSDIHVELLEHYIKIRMRKNGVLFIYKLIDKSIFNELMARIKILSSLDIAERRRPQDGRFTYHIGEKKIDIRVSTISTILGEKAVLRLLDPLGIEYTLMGIGLNSSQKLIVEKLLRQPQGLILICGPTGSGKTSSLYAFLQQLNKPEQNIITIEDPVEFAIEGINQIQVNKKAGITFESGLSSILRQDPEIIMVGEIRNKETAEIALRSSITGHLILSTLHSMDSPSSILRLIDMGIEPYMVSAGLLAVISQRLIRQLCPKCKEEIVITDSFFGLNEVKSFQAHGCSFCRDGYIGRYAIFELFVLEDTIKEHIRKDINIHNIKNRAVEEGMVTLKETLRHEIVSGNTSLEEAYRVIITL